jgi:predicted membrane-bound spermidine synthase
VRLAIVSLILFLSGASALLFQTLWLRLSGLAFGNSIWAAALILSSFMAGLALGSAIAASLNLQGWRPLRVYAGLETTVALFGCTLVFALPHLGEGMRPIFQALWHHQGTLNALRFGISFLILLVPTTAMGLSLPILLEDSFLRDVEFRQSIGLLYGCNTLGAVIGALAGETFLIKSWGLLGTGLTAGGVSILAASLALVFAGRPLAPAGKLSSRHRLRLSLGVQPPWTLLLVSTGTGAILLGLEVIWFRFLRLYVASTSTAFCIMLAVVLLGIGLGGVASSVIPPRLASPRKLLPALLFLAAIGTLLSYLFFPLPTPTADTQAFYIEPWPQIMRLSLALMFPVAFLSGIVLPILITCVQAQIANRVNSTGLTILFNTFGAALGPLLAGFVLLPSLGFQTSLIIAAAGYAVLAIATTDRTNWSLRQPSGVLLLLLALGLVSIVALFPYQRDEMHFANARRFYEQDGSRLQRKIEGDADTLQLLRRDLFGEPYYYRLVTNAYSMSGTLPRSQRYMRLFAYLPLALRPQSERALLLCYGVGVTADALTRDMHLKHIDVVDTSKEVFQLASSYTGPGYSNPLRDSRVATFVQDGRFFLQASPQQYDIITGEPPPLKVSGTVNLYTQQFFFLMRARLKEGGIATFWLPIYQVTPAEMKAILRAFSNIFPNASVWAAGDLEWIMMGIKEPLPKPNEKSAQELWRDEKIRSDLFRIGIEEPSQLSSLFLMDANEIDSLTQDVAPLTDNFPKRLTDVQPDLKTTYRLASDYLEGSGALRRFESSSLIEKIWPEEWKQSLDLYFVVREMRFRLETTGGNWLAALDFYLHQTKLQTPVLNILNSDQFRLRLAQDFAAKSGAVPSTARFDLVAGALARRDLDQAVALLETGKAENFANDNEFFLLTYLYCVTGKVEKAEALAATKSLSRKKDWFVDWLWGTLQAEYGFRPPPSS